MSEEEKKVEEAPAPALVMPDLNNGAAQFLEDEKLHFWVGIPMVDTDPMFAMTILDKCKFDLWNAYNAHAQTIITRRQLRMKQINPKGMDMVKHVLGNLKDKATSLFQKNGKAPATP